MIVSAQTDIGRSRNENQDAYVTGQTPGGITWAVVCDGMGGAAGGSTASKIAVDAAAQLIRERLSDDSTPENAAVILRAAAILGNNRILKQASVEPTLSGMGTTYVAAVAFPGEAVIVHCGDSRCYHISSDGEIRQITKDHSYVQGLVDKGEITPDEAENHIYKNIITRALGAAVDIQTDLKKCGLRPGDMLLLCSDGLSNMVTLPEMIDIIKNNESEDIPPILIDAANKNGGKDNITVAIISV